jgi:hypothetical protein
VSDYLDFYYSTRFCIWTLNLFAVGSSTHLAFHSSPFPKVDGPSEACTVHFLHTRSRIWTECAVHVEPPGSTFLVPPFVRNCLHFCFLSPIQNGSPSGGRNSVDSSNIFVLDSLLQLKGKNARIHCLLCFRVLWD